MDFSWENTYPVSIENLFEIADEIYDKLEGRGHDSIDYLKCLELATSHIRNKVLADGLIWMHEGDYNGSLLEKIAP